MKTENMPILGKTLTGVSVSKIRSMDGREDLICFTCSDGTEYIMYHDQECGEEVVIDDISGDLDDLIGTPLVVAHVASRSLEPDGTATCSCCCTSESLPTKYGESATWTFYVLATRLGYVNIRWLGESNGYYSERVTFAEKNLTKQ